MSSLNVVITVATVYHTILRINHLFQNGECIIEVP
jgi:hypothetical protein